MHSFKSYQETTTDLLFSPMSITVLLLEYMTFKQEGGELFLKDFQKLRMYNEIQCWITEKEIKETKNQNYFKMI